jgi:excisionase family DNA binding protein
MSVQVATPERRPFFTQQTLAAYLCLHERTIRLYIENGELPAYKIGRTVRIAAEDVDAWLARHREGGRRAA